MAPCPIVRLYASCSFGAGFGMKYSLVFEHKLLAGLVDGSRI